MLLLACTQAEHPLKGAVEHFGEGKQALAAGDPSGAVEAFSKAQSLDPQSAELALWHAQALAESGALPEAIAQADLAVRLAPGMVEGWYNRACYKARAGDLEGAAADLAQALRSPELEPLVVAVDPDLQVLREHPELAGVMPAAELPLSVRLDPGPHFLGAEVDLALSMERGAAAGMQLQTPSDPLAPVRPVSVLQELDPDHPGALSLRVRLKVLAPGEVTLGPFTLQSSGLEGKADPVSMELLAPAGTQPPEQPWTPRWPLPSELLTGAVGARSAAGACLVELAPGDTLRWEATQVVELELREGTRVLRTGALGQSSAGAPVVIERAGAEVWSGSCPD